MSKPSINSKIFASLPGRWIISRKSSNGLCYRGVGVFIPKNEYCLNYKEQGKIYGPNLLPLNTYQTYRYGLEDKTLSVYIAHTNQLLHKLAHLPQRPNILHGVHYCGRDVYNAEYEFIAKDKFFLTYNVIGPHKKYTINSIFTFSPDNKIYK